ncbi:exopolyphosphatase [Basilea psittacipulmonis]|uniref:exopolyphosphatase n=1 Tax=Basilea psittacipulmonis TaxID=1472345 RepID=UPI0011773364|nr:exopolyphosphatase [Basilea psittacipulmonis]
MDNQLAAIDLGSNSFRLSIGTIEQRDGISQIYSNDRLKETVRLASGLDEHNYLSEEAIERAINVLKLFGDRIEGFPADRVRAVATNTFRVAKNVNDFLPRAEAALGYPIEVISGQEEARLIFSGVVHELPPSDNKRLVIDIGGGSTEFIIGKGLDPLIVKSLHMGCVSYTQRFFPGGQADETKFKQAELAASKELESIIKPYRKIMWDEVYGSSGTAKALVAVLQECGFSDQGITLEGMEKLKKIILKHGVARVTDLSGLKDSRQEVLPAGLAIMMAIFKALKIERMNQGEGALRVGVLYDLIGRKTAVDKRNESVLQFMQRYHVSQHQAQRVKSLAEYFFDQIFHHDESKKELRQMLSWAAQLHEIGISISQSSYHRHSAYIIENADMPGFSKSDQQLLSLIVLGHQGSLSKLKDISLSGNKENILLTIFCLRLATLLMRKRRPIQQTIEVSVNHSDWTIRASKKWLSDHALTRYSLELESKAWKDLGIHLDIQKTSS